MWVLAIFWECTGSLARERCDVVLGPSVVETAKPTGFNAFLAQTLASGTRELCFEPTTAARLAPTYRRFSCSFDGPVVRDDSYWQSWFVNPAEGFEDAPDGAPLKKRKNNAQGFLTQIRR